MIYTNPAWLGCFIGFVRLALSSGNKPK